MHSSYRQYSNSWFRSVSLAAVCVVMALLMVPTRPAHSQGQVNVLAWAVGVGAIGGDEGRGIALDAAGNVYTTGHFEGAVDFDPGPGTFNLTDAGVRDVFVQKLDADGNFVWARAMGGVSSDMGYDIALDGDNNVYVVGRFAETVDFDPGPGTFNLTSVGPADVFVLKLDADGNFIWAISAGGTRYDVGYGVAADAAGNVYTTGIFAETVDFDPGPGTFNLTSAGGVDIFVQKLDANGDFIWAGRMGGLNSDRGHDIAIDASGDVLTTGYYIGTVDFDPGAGVFNLTTGGPPGIFVQKLDANGDFIWARGMAGGIAESGEALAVDAANNVHVTGYFTDTVDFDPGPGTLNLTSNGEKDFFVQKFDTDGNLVWVRRVGGVGFDLGYGIALDAAGNIYTTGSFANSVDFDPGPGTFNLTSAALPGDSDIFLQKLDANGDFVWAVGMVGRLGGTGQDVVVSGSGDVHATGAFNGTVDFDPGEGTFDLTCAGIHDIFVLKLVPPPASPEPREEEEHVVRPAAGDIKGVDREVAGIGDTLTYTIRWPNPSDATVTEVAFEDLFDAQLDHVTVVSVSHGTASVTGNTVRVEGFELAAGDVLEVVVTAAISEQASPGDVIRNYATLTSPDLSTHRSNTVRTTVVGLLPDTGFEATGSRPVRDASGWLPVMLLAGGALVLAGLVGWRCRES